MKRNHLIWICVLYFGLLFKYYSGFTIWGNPGFMGTGADPDATITVARAAELIETYAKPLRSLTWLVGFGAILTIIIALLNLKGSGDS